VHFRRGAVGTAAEPVVLRRLDAAARHGHGAELHLLVFLAAFILGAALRARRPVNVPLMLAVALGFAGVVLVLQPSFGAGQWLAPPAGCFGFFRRPPTGTCATSHGRASRNGGSSSTSRSR